MKIDDLGKEEMVGGTVNLIIYNELHTHLFII